MVVVDLRTRRISAETDIYVARPGPNYRFFELFVESKFVGPDLPGLNLPAFTDLDEVEDLSAYVARSAAIRRWRLSGNREELTPSRNLADYQGRRPSRSVAQLTRVVRAYFKLMKKGDLVVVPPASFRAMAEIGEFAAEPNHTRKLFHDRYLDDLLEGRQISWLASIPKGDLPSATLDALQKPSPLFLLPVNFKEKIFRRAYGAYYDDFSYSVRFEVSSETFRIKDDFYIQSFFNFITANFYRIKEGEAQLLDFRAGAFEDVGVRAPNLFTNVNSPGGLSLKSLAAVPIVIAALLAIAVVIGPEAHSLAQAGNLAIVNSFVDDGDPCVAEVSSQVITQLQLLGYDRWQEACQFAREAANATGIESGVQVGNAP